MQTGEPLPRRREKPRAVALYEDLSGDDRAPLPLEKLMERKMQCLQDEGLSFGLQKIIFFPPLQYHQLPERAFPESSQRHISVNSVSGSWTPCVH